MEVELGAMRAVLGRLRDNGIIYYPAGNYDNKGETTSPYFNGLIVSAIVNWYERDQNPHWLDWIEELTQGTSKVVIEKGDRAYIPPECSLDTQGKWQWTTRGAAKIPYTPPDEPTSEQQGLEGCVKFHQGHVIRALVQYDHYRAFGPGAIVLAGKMVRFCMKPGMWEDADTTPAGYPAREHGVWAGHVHGNLAPIKVLLEYATATHDEWLKQAVREAYEFWRNHSVVRIGWSTGWVHPEKHGRDPLLLHMCEACAIADAVALGVKMSDAGMGDWWDDVDAIVRNGLVEQQFMDLGRMKNIAG